MFDVVRSETRNDTVNYYCVNDVQETHLFAHLEEIINQQIDNDKSPFASAAKSLFKILNSLNYFHTERFVFNLAGSPSSSAVVLAEPGAVIFLEVPTPPPDFFA